MLQSVRVPMLVVTLLACAVAPVVAQQSAADRKEIATYRLTPEGLRKYDAVADHLVAWVKASPEAQAAIRLGASVDSLRKKDELTDAEQARLEKLEEQLAKLDESTEQDGDDNDTIAGMTAGLVKQKPVADALRKAGFAPREFVLFSMAMFQASAFAQMKQQGMSKHIPKDANVEHIRFAEQNAAAFQATMAKLQKAEQGYKILKRGS